MALSDNKFSNWGGNEDSDNDYKLRLLALKSHRRKQRRQLWANQRLRKPRKALVSNMVSSHL